MRVLFITLICLAVLLAAIFTIYTTHRFRDIRLRDRLGLPTKAAIRDIGVVELSPDTPRLFQLDDRRVLAVTASVITNETFLASNQAVLLRRPEPMTNDMFQISVAYTSRTERLVRQRGRAEALPVPDASIVSRTEQRVRAEQQFFTGLQNRQMPIHLERDSDNPVVVLMTPRLRSP